MTTPLEFIDYIFDRYAYLGIEPDASVDTLRVEIRRRRAENHPDKLIHVSEAIRATAARDMDRVNECARVLLDETLRARYDERLAEFRESSPRLVSTTGVPIFDPCRARIDLESLLGEQTLSLQDLESHAAQMAGYSEKRVERARARFQAEPDSDTREELREHLTAKLVFLSIIEEYYWQKAGVYGAVAEKDALTCVAHSQDVLAYHHEQISQARERIEHAAVERHAVAQLGFAPLLLLGHHREETDSTEVVREVAAAATQAFEMRVEDLRALLEKKKLTIDELLPLARTRQLRASTGSGIVDIVLIQSDAEVDDAWPGEDYAQMGIVIRCETATGVASPLLVTLSAEELANWPNELHVLAPNRELPGLFLEAVALAERLTNAIA